MRKIFIYVEASGKAEDPSKARIVGKIVPLRKVPRFKMSSTVSRSKLGPATYRKKSQPLVEINKFFGLESTGYTSFIALGISNNQFTYADAYSACKLAVS